MLWPMLSIASSLVNEQKSWFEIPGGDQSVALADNVDQAEVGASGWRRRRRKLHACLDTESYMHFDVSAQTNGQSKPPA